MYLFVCKNFKNLDELVETRMTAMRNFLEDFNEGKKQGRYIVHELPEPSDFKNQQFDIGLSSYFLLLYSNLGFEFHIMSIKEIRIFPIVDLDAKNQNTWPNWSTILKQKKQIEIKKANYELQINENQMLVISNK